MEGKIFAPLTDVQGNICRLVDINTKTVAARYDFTAFGEKLSSHTVDPQSPWQFASKRFDPELELIYFGKRYYDPKVGRWITPDPAGFVDSYNPYQYVLNNPFRYVDPDGQFVFAIPLVVWGATVAAPTLTAIGTYIATGMVTGAIAYGGYKLIEYSCQKGYAPGTVWDLPSRAQQQELYRQDLSRMQKKKQVDEPLPSDPDQLLNNPVWTEISHPGAKENGRRTFENVKTGEKLRHDTGKPGETGHRGDSHWHRFNPDAKGKQDKFLDGNGNPVPVHSDPSHLYPS